MRNNILELPDIGKKWRLDHWKPGEWFELKQIFGDVDDCEYIIGLNNEGHQIWFTNLETKWLPYENFNRMTNYINNEKISDPSYCIGLYEFLNQEFDNIYSILNTIERKIKCQD